MPVRINLKELFGSDSQEITIDKLNFNFNKLLELGVGLKGDRGLTGPIGPAGPIGPVGPQGDQGNYWFVGTGDPNGLSLNPSDEDFYMDTDTSQIWQYDETTMLWSILIDLEGVVNDYLVVNGSPFVRGFGSASPQDSRYITFTTRGGTPSDQAGDSKGSNSTQNDILFLNNFDESSGVLTITSDLSDTDSTYTAIQKIAVDATLGASNERYGLEIGSLYALGSDIYLSDFNSSLKLHHISEDISGTQINDPSIGVNNSGIDVKSYGVISVAGHYGNIAQNPDNDYLNILDLQSPRRDAIVGSNEIFHTKIGSKFALIEDQSWVRYDGILFESGSISGGIGIARDFSISGQSGNDYLMIDSGVSADGILLNNDTYQDNGDIKQLSTGDLEIGSVVSKSGYGYALSKLTYGNGAVLNSGNLLYSIESISTDGSTDYRSSVLTGRVYVCDASNELNPIYLDTILARYYHTGHPAAGSPKVVVGSGIIDSDQIGDHLVVVNDMDSRTYDTSVPPYGPVQYGVVNLQTLKYNGTGSSPNFERTGMIINDPDLYSAYRIKSSGNISIVATNRLKYWENLATSGVSAANSNYNEIGKLVLIDTSDLDSPIKGDVYVDSDINHYLDIYKMNQGLYAIPSIKLGAIDGTDTYFSDCELRLNIATVIDGIISVDSVTLSTISNLQNLNYEDSTIWSPFATVTAHEGWIYVAHQNKLYICTYIEGTLSVYSTYSFDSDSDARSLDSKLLGDTLYILIGTGGSTHWSPTDSSIVKINISNRTLPVVVNKTSIGEASSTKMTIVGNSIYVNKVNGVGNGFLIPIKFDGTYADGANIGSLKASSAIISNDLNIGRSLNINGGLTVGASGVTSAGEVSANTLVSNKLRVPSGSNVEYVLPTSDGSSGNVLITDGSGNLSWGSNGGWTEIGSKVQLTDTSNQVSIGTGTALTPALSFYNDLDTGMFRYSSNMIGFTTGGIEKVIITDSGYGSDTNIKGIVVKDDEQLQNRKLLNLESNNLSGPYGDSIFMSPSNTGGAYFFNTTIGDAVIGATTSTGTLVIGSNISGAANGWNAMSIKQGKVSIGQIGAQSTYWLSVVGNTGNYIANISNTGIGDSHHGLRIKSETNTTGAVLLACFSNEGSNGTKFAVYSDGRIAGDAGTYHTSDINLKTDISSINSRTSDILKLNPVTFKWKDREDQSVQAGFIAQEVQNIFPDLVWDNPDSGFLTLNSTGLIPHLVKTIQELLEDNSKLESRLKAIEEKLGL